MNLKDFTLIFVFITLALFTVFFVKTEVSQQFLNESKVEKNYTSSSALDSSGSTVALMEKYDYDLDSVDYYNNTVLDIAFCEKNKDWIDYLFYMGAKQYKKDLY